MDNGTPSKDNLVKFRNGNREAIVGEAPGGEKLILEALLDKKLGIRKYRLYEELPDSSRLGEFSEEAVFEPNEIAEANYSQKIDRRIRAAVGKYSKTDVKKRIAIIEKNHSMKHEKEINAEVLSEKQIVETLIKFFKDNMDDERLLFREIHSDPIVGIVGREDKTARENFNDIMLELFRGMNPKDIKDRLRIDGYFKTDYNRDCNDCQYTLASGVRKLYNIRGDKAYAFDFGEDNKSLLKLYHQRKELEENWDEFDKQLDEIEFEIYSEEKHTKDSNR